MELAPLNSISIKLISQDQHRFTTIGYWEEDGQGNVTFWVTRMSDWRYMICTLFHEMVEWAWCRANGVTTEDADRFDALYEELYDGGRVSRLFAPGDDPTCPYHYGHIYGGIFDALIGAVLGVPVEAMDAECDDLLGLRPGGVN